MWEFLRQLLQQYGLAAVLVLATYAGLALAIRELWNRGNATQDALTKAHKDHGEAFAKEQGAALGREASLLDREQQKRLAMRAEHEKELQLIREQLRLSAAHFTERLDGLQEQRNDELRSVLREALQHIGATRAAVDKITDAMQTLKDVVRR